MRNKFSKLLTGEYPPLGNKGIFAKTWKYAACMLLAFILGIGQMWGATITWNTADNSTNSDVTIADGKNATFTGDDESTVLTYTYSKGCKRLKNNGGLSMNGASQYNNSSCQRYLTFKAPSSTGTVSLTLASINGKTDGTGTATVRIYGGTTVAYNVSTLNSPLTSPTIHALQSGTSDIIITFSAKCIIKEVKWTDVAVPSFTTVYANNFTASPMGVATVAYSNMSSQSDATSGWIGWASGYTGGYKSSSSSCSATLTFATPLELNSDGTDCGRIRIYWGHVSNNKTLGLKVNGSSVSFDPTTVANTLYPKVLNVAEYVIPKTTTTISSIAPSGSGSTGTYLFRIEVLTHSVTPAVGGDYTASFTSAKGTAPDDEENIASVTLAEITGVDGFKHVGWTADQTVTVDETEVSAGTLIANGKTATLSANTEFTAVWKTEINPSLSYNNSVLVLTMLTSATPTLSGNTGSGAVTWSSSATGVASVDGSGNVTAEGVGTAEITATIAANGDYAGGEAKATIKVVAAPTHLIENRLNVASGDWYSEIYTSDMTNISNLVAWQIAEGQDRTAGVTDKQSIKNSRTHGIGTTAEKVDGYYMYLGFRVADGKELTLSAVNIPVFGIAASKTTLVEIEDANSTKISVNGTITQDADGNGFGTYDFSGAPALQGTVTMKMWAYDATSGYRMKSPVYIDGTVAAIGACTTPTITWDGTQPENAYVSDGSKTFVMNSNYAAGIAPELSENTCGATIAVKAGTDNKRWVVSFTSAGSVKITPKVVGDGTTVCAETVSGTAKTLTVTQAYDVTFNMNGHGAAIAKQVVADGAKAKAPFVADVADWVFGGWFTDAGCTAGNEFDFANTTITADIPLYAKWTADACAGDRKSLSKVVLTSASDGTVTGYNGKEYAGDAVIGGLSSTETAEVDASHDGVETGYKLNNGGSAIVFATLKKGAFQEGDKVVVTITKKQDSYKIESVSQPVLHIYYGTNASDPTKLTTLEGVSAAGSYTYRLTAADVAAIGEKKGIGVFRENSNGQNPYVYSVEITGCRSFAVTHDVNFNMMGYGTAITKQTIEVGAKVTEPAEPEAAGYIFGGWYKENTLVNKWDFSTDVMPDNDITLYAKWTEDPCTDRQSLSKVVLTAADNGAVTGYNGKEYAGEKVIGGLNSTETAEVDDSHVGLETGYKLSSGGSAIVFATLAKGTFQEGDKVVVTITKQQDNYKIGEVAQPILDIYYGTDKDDATFLTTIKGVNAAGTYTYRLTADDVTAIGEKKGIGVFRPSTGRVQNPYVYSVEITGCRSWAVSHTVSFNMHDHGSAIDPQDVFEGGKVTEPATPSATDWAFVGWYKEDTYENEWDFDTDVMGTSDITLHAKWESEVGAIKLFDGEGNLNTTNFVSPAKTTITIDEVEYPTLVAFGSNRSSELKGTKQADMVQYNAATDAAKIKFELYNNNGSAKTAYLWLVEEGDETATPIEINVPGKTRVTTAYYTFNSTKNRSFYLTSGAKDDIKVMQVTVLDNGTAIHQFGQAGYVLNLNKGRIGVAANGTVQFEGARIHSNEEYSVLNSSNLKPKTYIQFNNAVANTVVKITKASSNKYYVTNDLENKGDEYSTDKEIVLTTTGTWYIGSVTSGSVAALSKIEFIAPKCAEPAFNSLANSDLCEGAAFEALNGTATVGDAGTPIYQWYKADGDVEIEGATSATYTPTADGSYYVVATNQLAGYSDNSKKSNTVTVTHFAAAEITTAPLNQRGLKDAEVTLSVAATGKNLSYAWFTCDNEAGDNPEAVVPAATGTSLSVTITEGMNQWYKVVVSSDCGSASATAKVEQFVPVAPANVTESTTWDWTSAAWPASGEAKFTNQIDDGTDFTPDYELLANANSIVPNNEGFHSDMLYGKGQYVWRSSNKFFQGTALKFTTTVPGRVRVYFRSTGNNKHVQVVINTKLAGTYEADGFRWSDYVYVPAGDVEIICTGTDVNKAMTRIQKIEFETPSYTRTEMLGNGVYGTICVDHNVPEGGIRGVTVYEIAGREPQYGKIAFDEITEMEAGVPYVFIAHGDRLELYYGATSVDNPDNRNGMYGTFTAKTLTELDDIYYFAKSALWGCADLTSLSLPANRAYVKLSEIDYLSSGSNPAPGRRRIVMGVQGEQVATGMENVQGDNVQCTKMMIDGQLFILRGEKMYDATGRLVK